jgi:hypothetical protein
LRQLIEELQKDIREKQIQIETAVNLLRTTEREVALIEKVEVPITKEVRIEELFKPEEGGLEARAREIDLRLREDIRETAQRPIEEIYSELKNIYQQQQRTGVETEEQRAEVYVARKALEEKRQATQRGEYAPSEKAETLFTATEDLIRRMYKT